MLLEVKEITVSYDKATLLDRVSVNVDSGETVALVGPNGSGKTTMLRAIAGLVKWDIDTLKGTTLSNITFDGSITFNGEEIKGLPAHKIAQKGLVLCPQGGRPFREMTVTDNLLAGAYLSKDNRTRREALEKIYQVFPVLKERGKQIAGTLSGGERNMLAIARALMSQPKLLLIDELSTGLAPIVKEGLLERIKAIHDMGISLFLVEQDVGFAFELSSRNYVLSSGHVVAEGSAHSLLDNEVIRKIYLGL
ncbi:MAG: ABC transporter ATP-binding protein [Chloroflexi bacterium]|nr:ABC transporter ATP-binding protein [Chloroflexota bacterium]